MLLRQFLTKAAFIVCVAASFVGCATKTQIAEQGVKANLAVEDAANQVLLLNVIRATKRRPMHFTRFQVLRGPIGIGAPAVTLPLPFGPDFATQIYNLSVTQTLDKPSFDVQIMDTQKFLQGITKPVATKTMLYYLDQGWPQQMILHIFVREFEEIHADGSVTSIVNYPQNKREFAKFQKIAEGLQGCDFLGDTDDIAAKYGPVLSRNQVGDIEKLVAVKTAEMVLAPVDANGNKTDVAGQIAGYQLMKITKVPIFKIVQSKQPGAPPCRSPNLAIATSKENQMAQGGSPTTLRMQLRSPEAMVYYLGELTRAQIDGGFSKEGDLLRDMRPAEMGIPRVKIGFPRRPDDSGEILFKVTRVEGGSASQSSRAAVRVTYDDVVYEIPDTDAGRSMHVLSLVSQMLNLQNEGAEVPSTATVRIGG